MLIVKRRTKKLLFVLFLYLIVTFPCAIIGMMDTDRHILQYIFCLILGSVLLLSILIGLIRVILGGAEIEVNDEFIFTRESTHWRNKKIKIKDILKVDDDETIKNTLYLELKDITNYLSTISMLDRLFLWLYPNKKKRVAISIQYAHIKKKELVDELINRMDV